MALRISGKSKILFTACAIGSVALVSGTVLDGLRPGDPSLFDSEQYGLLIEAFSDEVDSLHRTPRDASIFNRQTLQSLYGGSSRKQKTTRGSAFLNPDKLFILVKRMMDAMSRSKSVTSNSSNHGLQARLNNAVFVRNRDF